MQYIFMQTLGNIQNDNHDVTTLASQTFRTSILTFYACQSHICDIAWIGHLHDSNIKCIEKSR